MTELNTNSRCCSPFAINSNDLKIYIDSSKCSSCGLCGELCPFGLIGKNKYGKFEIIDPISCTECSAC